MNNYQIAIDSGNYDLKYWNGDGHPKAIRSTKFTFPQRGRRNALKSSEASPVLEYKDRKYHFTRMLLTGGSSLLVSDLIPQKAILKPIPDPRFANVRGLYPLSVGMRKAS